MSIAHLTNLDGLKGVVTAQFATSRTNAMHLVRSGKIVTAAGPDGALNIWRTKKGELRAQFYRRLASQSYQIDLTLTDLNLWLKKWWPEMGR